MTPCARPIELETLIAWWLGELQEEALETHLLGCAYCAGRAQALAAYAQGIRAAVRRGALGLVLTPGFLDALKQEGLRIREYAVAPGGRVECTIRADDDAVLSRLRAPLAGAGRVDALQSVAVEGRLEHSRIEDLPFDAQAGEVLYMPSAAALKKMPAHTWRVQLVAVDKQGERPLGEYTFAHTPG